MRGSGTSGAPPQWDGSEPNIDEMTEVIRHMRNLKARGDTQTGDVGDEVRLEEA